MGGAGGGGPSAAPQGPSARRVDTQALLGIAQIAGWAWEGLCPARPDHPIPLYLHGVEQLGYVIRHPLRVGLEGQTQEGLVSPLHQLRWVLGAQAAKEPARHGCCFLVLALLLGVVLNRGLAREGLLRHEAAPRSQPSCGPSFCGCLKRAGNRLYVVVWLTAAAAVRTRGIAGPARCCWDVGGGGKAARCGHYRRRARFYTDAAALGSCYISSDIQGKNRARHSNIRGVHGDGHNQRSGKAGRAGGRAKSTAHPGRGVTLPDEYKESGC